MSLLGKTWMLYNKPLEALRNRKLDDESVAFHNPFVLEDMERAVERIGRAIHDGERILVFGDYDVDGISGTAILIHTLRALKAQVSYRLPTRQDGYGLNVEWIGRFNDLKVNVVITVDCGISNALEMEKAMQYGMDMIVTDHHVVPEHLPKAAYAILHPNLPGSTYPFKHLSGSGMAYKLAVALWQTLGDPGEAEIWQDRLVDLASLGTVADCVPLIGENRWIVKKGIDQMKVTHWIGLDALLKSAGIEAITGYDSDLIGFRLGPRLNASGRLETPYFSLQLLLNENDKAHLFTQKLEALNGERQSMMEEAFEQAQKQVASSPAMHKNIIIVWSSEWPAGIIGLIAAKLSEERHRPAIVMEDRGEVLVGSCRSPEFFNMVEALTACSEHLKTFGGHAAAAGFSLGKAHLSHFVDAMQTFVEKRLEGRDLAPILTIDHEIDLKELNLELVHHVDRLAPYGTENPKPRFLIKNITPQSIQTVGREQRHLKFYVPSGSQSISAIGFRLGEHHKALNQAKAVDVVCEISRSVWQGRERLEMKIVDMRKAE